MIFTRIQAIDIVMFGLIEQSSDSKWMGDLPFLGDHAHFGIPSPLQGGRFFTGVGHTSQHADNLPLPVMEVVHWFVF